MSPRATPMPPDERRAAIVAAALPLLEEHGTDVSTKRIAEAAGIAEGTIFRAFGSKDALIEAAVRTAFDSAPLLDRLRAIDPALPLRERTIAAVEAGQSRLSAVFRLMLALRMRPPAFADSDEARRKAEADEARRKADSDEADRLFADLLRPDADQLRYPVEEVVHRLRLLVFSATHPLISGGRTLTAEEIVDFAFDGVRHHDSGDH